MPEIPGQPAQQPASQGQQPPFGSSQATQPTQNAGHRIAGLKLVGLGLMALENAIPLVGASTPEGADVLKSIQSLSKHIPPGTVTPQDIKNVVQKLMLTMQQGQQQMQAMQAQRQPQQAPQQAAQPNPMMQRAA